MTRKNDSKLSIVDSKSTDTKPDALTSAANAALDMTLEDLSCIGLAQRIIKCCMEQTFPSESARVAMAGEMKASVEIGRSLLLNDDFRGFRQVFAKLDQRRVELSRPLAETAAHPPRDVNDLPDLSRRGLASCGWSGQEIDWLVIRLMQTKQILGTWDSRSAMTVAGRPITRQELRESAAPQNELHERFLQSLPKIPETQTEVTNGPR